MNLKTAYNSQLKDELTSAGASWSLKFKCFIELVRRRLLNIKITAEQSMPKFEIEVKEIKKVKYSIDAKTVEEAKDLAYWRLYTQTRPSVKAEVSYDVFNTNDQRDNFRHF